MQSRSVRQLAAVVSLLATLGAVALHAPAAGARTPAQVQVPAFVQPMPQTPGVEVAPAATEQPLLDEPEHGLAAIEALGTDLPEAAALNDTEPRELRELLLEDRTAWLDTQGALFYKEPGHAQSDALPAPQAAYPHHQTFLLHSRPGSQRTIYLDFDGGTVSGSQWNASYPAMATSQPAWTLDADATTFNAAEQDAIQFVYDTVAEDYAPFDVDVTTQDPGMAALSRDTYLDATYGSWALITPSTSASDSICGGGCGGVAYVGSFNAWPSGQYQPAWVFPHKLLNDAKAIAEATSHEVGHNLGLNHDGKAAAGYYGGQGAWAPVMGSSYTAPIGQWSIGDYASPTNTEDDLAVMQATGATLRADDHATGTSGASPLGTGLSAHRDGVISHRGDRDVFIAQTSCTGTLTANATPAAVAPNLDIKLRLLDAHGSPLASVNPPSAKVSGTSASGMGASLSQSVAPGTYFIEVDGAGMGDALTTGYSDYGSLGAFGLDVTGCLSGSTYPYAMAPVPSFHSSGEETTTAVWQAPGNATAAGVTSYRVRLYEEPGGTPVATATVTAPTTVHEFTGLRSGTSYTFDVTAIGVAGDGPTSIRSSEATPPWPVAGAPTGVSATPGQGQATLTWVSPSNAEAAGVSSYRVRWFAGSGATVVGSVDAAGSARSLTVTGLAPGTAYTFDVSAVGPAGDGARSARSAPVTPTAARPGKVIIGTAAPGVTGGSITATARWTRWTSSAVTGYKVTALRLDAGGRVLSRTVSAMQPASQSSLSMVVPLKGTYAFTVQAFNQELAGPASATSNRVTGR